MYAAASAACLPGAYHPITILSTLPSARAVGLLTLMLFRQDLSAEGITGIALLMGTVNMSLRPEPGSALRRPLGIAVLGGLLLSQVLTRYTTPVINIFFDRLPQLIIGHQIYQILLSGLI